MYREPSSPNRHDRKTFDEPAIASPHTLATEAANNAFGIGGNALDAALTAAATLTVVYPHACSLGGDLIALVVDPLDQIVVINSTGASSGTNRSDFWESGRSVMPERGPVPITVPGVLAGWEAIANLGCRLSLAERLETAITLALEGCPVARSVDRAIRDHPEIVLKDPGLSSVLSREGRLLGHSETMVQTALGRTIERLADTGLKDFYEGDLAERVVQALQGVGSTMTLGDLAAHQVDRVEPLSIRFYDWSVFAPPPNSQGFALLSMLLCVESMGLDFLGPEAGATARMFRAISEERDARLADPRVAKIDIDDLLTPDLAVKLIPSKGTKRPCQPNSHGDRRGDTVAVVAADRDGWIVCLVQSVFSSFGAGILDPLTGILFHNRGYGFSLDPESPNRYQPRKRPAHTLTPVIAKSERGAWLSLSTMGAKATPQVLTQVLSRVARGRSLAEAIDAPRWIVGGLQAPAYSEVYSEARVPNAALDSFIKSGLSLVRLNDRDEDAGQTNAMLVESGRLTAVADRRSDG